MIYDNLKNINIYKGLSDDIYEGLVFLKNVKPNIENGVYEINTRVKAIVSEYETKKVNEYGFEAHKRFIDIQYVLQGTERVCCLPLEKLNETKPYSEDNDAAFYSASSKPLEMIIGDGFFSVFYPQDGHMPCLSVDGPKWVKKVVLKVDIFLK